MKKVIKLTENDLTKIVKRIIMEQSKVNHFKEKIADLISDVNSRMSSDYWRDADDLMMIYNKLLPLKGKKVGAGAAKRYIEMDYSQQNPDLSALQYFNKMYGRVPNNRYGMGSTDFITRIKQVGDKTMSGYTEKTKDGKYTTKQVKQMIIDLIKNDGNNQQSGGGGNDEKKPLKNCDTFPIKFGCQNQKLIPFQKCLNAKETGVFDDQTYSKIIDYFVGRMSPNRNTKAIDGGHVVMANKLKFDGLDNEFYTKIINNCKKTIVVTPTIDQVKDCKNGRSFKIGMKGESIKKIQGLLGTKYANILGVSNKQQYDGDFGPKTKKAVIQFQTDNNLTPDGAVGCKTIGKMLEILRSSVKPTETPNKPISPDATLGDQSNMVSF